MARYTVIAGWNDVPHLTEAMKEQFLESVPPSHRAVRTEGQPHLGSGQIWPVPEEDVACDPITIPKHWPKGFGLDTGWKDTGVVFCALHPEADILYIYSVYKRGLVEHPVHAAAIQSKGAWIPGVGDAAARNLKDGRQFIQMYRDFGIDLELANKAVETGIGEVWTRLSSGRLKVFSTCDKWFDEFRTYIRDEKGQVVKRDDHLMDATRYMVMSGIQRMKRPPELNKRELTYDFVGATSWMGA